jgi:phosphoglycolate phosphatase
VLVLFDVDGTLLASRGAGAEAVLGACAELFGRPFAADGRAFAGSLDPLIWRALCAAHGVPDPDRHHARFRAAYARRLAQLFAERGRARALAGVPELVAALARRPRTTLGLLTGNYAETGRLKLAAAGLDAALFPVAAWGDDAPDRRGLVPVAIERCAALGGGRPAPREVVVVGDTPRDVDCARAHGCRSLAVATGSHTVVELAAAGADLALEDLADTARVLAWLDGTAA